MVDHGHVFSGISGVLRNRLAWPWPFSVSRNVLLILGRLKQEDPKLQVS